MTFKSASDFMAKRGRKAAPANVRVSGKNYAVLSSSVRESLNFSGRVVLEIDSESRKIRLSTHTGHGNVVSPIGGFSLLSAISSEVGFDHGPVKIPLTLEPDGWWYGSY